MTVTQASFTAAMLDPDAAVPEGLQTPNGDIASKRFNVYRNNVAVSLSDALETAFPVVRKLVGEKFFRAMSGVYLRQHPPTSPLMMFYGSAMPAFLAGFDPAKSLPYLPDIARIELGMRHAYHAADSTPADGQTLGTLDPDALMKTRLRIAPAVQAITSDFPIYSIYRANTVADAPKPVIRAEAVLITRAGFDPDIHLINAAGSVCITALAQGQKLGEAIETAAGETLDLAGVLNLLLSHGAVTEIY